MIKGNTEGLHELKFKGQPLIPLVQGFSSTLKSGVVQADFQGQTRQRRKSFTNTRICDVTYLAETPEQQRLFLMFINITEGSPFIAYLRGSNGIIEPFIARSVAEWQETNVSSLQANYSTTLEINDVRDYGFDEAVYVLLSENGEFYLDWYQLIQEAIPNDRF